jgi:predicted ATPase
MSIKRIRISNFKSFDELDVTLGNHNILIGANASGKSNFLQIFRFLGDITNHGLKNAISLQGGVEYLRNTNLGSSKNLSLEVIYAPKPGTMNWQVPVQINGQDQTKLIARYFYEAIYKFTLEFTKDNTGFRVVEDKLTRKLKFCKPEHLQKMLNKEKVEEVGSGVMVFTHVEQHLEYEFIPEAVPPGTQDLVSRLSDIPALLNMIKNISPQTLFLETPDFAILDPFEDFFRSIPICDLDPRLPKKAISLTGKVDLEEDGSNLAIVLKNITEDEEQKRRFFNLVNYLLPFINDLRIEKFADKFIIPALQEEYAQNLYLPASFISDGTINIVALIIALYFDKKPFIMLEEPDRNIHPFLISKVVQMLEEASTQKQILATTHNPEMVKHAKLDNILLASRDKTGFSTITRPSEKDEIKIFLENEIGIKELYIQDLLGV